jgi:hypothetical protein
MAQPDGTPGPSIPIDVALAVDQLGQAGERVQPVFTRAPLVMAQASVIGDSLMWMTYESMMLFAETWIAAWNRRDIDAVLAHFADEAEFVSPAAHKFVGHSVLRNRKEIEAY